MSTYLPKKDDLNRKWFVIDAEGAVLGKLATAVADVLSGKRKPIYTPFLDTGDHVVVINAEKVAVSGTKEETKLYRRHSGYLGGLKTASVRQVREKRPSRIVEEAVKGMLPKTRLGRAMFTKLKVYAGSKHPHEAQRPTPLAVK
ncbi:MAG: 50S ribosomal protein L13 [Vicinamibacteria bacterium]|jgi:large subunit ribosomal protein L13|nr:50S ribosomal protein L13 [Vicinamibacteria bacterium]